MDSVRVQRYVQRRWLWLVINGTAGSLMAWLLVRVFRAPYSSGVQVVASGETQEIVLFSGTAALVFLVLSLACTPLALVLGFRRAISVRKSLGLWGFGFACMHGLFVLGGTALLAQTEAWAQLAQDAPQLLLRGRWSKIPYAPVGMVALLLLLPLALTSSRAAMRRLGRHWKRLHRLVYLAVPLGVWHHGWRVHAAEASPSYVQPALFGLLVGALLLLRIPRVRRALRPPHAKRETERSLTT